MKDKNLIVINKMIEEVSVAQSFLESKNLDSFLADEKIKRATCMTVINLGELVKNLDLDFRVEHPDVPWKAIAGFRDVAAHKYQTLHMEDVYITVVSDFPQLKKQLLTILDGD